MVKENRHLTAFVAVHKNDGPLWSTVGSNPGRVNAAIARLPNPQDFSAKKVRLQRQREGVNGVVPNPRRGATRLFSLSVRGTELKSAYLASNLDVLYARWARFRPESEPLQMLLSTGKESEVQLVYYQAVVTKDVVKVKASCFVAGIVKGLIEHGDATRHFGSLMSFQSHLHEAKELGLVRSPNNDRDYVVTQKGRIWYDSQNMKDLPDTRAYLWTGREWLLN